MIILRIFLVAQLYTLVNGAVINNFDKRAESAQQLATTYPGAGSDYLAALANRNLAAYVGKNGYPSNSCTLDNVAVRREWGSLSKIERRKYIDAVLCLQSKKSKMNSIFVPGAKSRFDDFVATHINQTSQIHGTGNFLVWHRYFTWTYEQALRNECGYTGYQPYWNWGRWAEDPESSPLFDGSDYSMSGNGAYKKKRPVAIPFNFPPVNISIPEGPGGGCVTDGPFANMKVNLGPVFPSVDYIEPPPLGPWLPGMGYNPRCLRRDINPYVSSRWNRDIDAVNLILQNPDIAAFQSRMQGDFPAGFAGVHTGGHFTIGGDPGGDLFASPGDPAFYLHHANIDRTWWTWQNMDIAKRTLALAGNTTLGGDRPTRLEDNMDIGVNAGEIKIKDAMNTIGGAPFCYIYV